MNQQELDYGLGGFIGQGSGQIAGANSGTVFTVPNQIAEAETQPFLGRNMTTPIMGAAVFGDGSTPTICLTNKATVPLGCDLQDLADALQIQADQFEQVWGSGCNLVISDVLQPRCWTLALLDDADQANALGYHDINANGLPELKAFVKTSEADNAAPSTVASHELLEALADPDVNTFKMMTGPNGAPYLAVLEVCDAVEQDPYAIQLPNGNKITVSNWVYPSWFESFTPAGVKLDYLGLCKKPFEIRTGGYLPVFNLNTQQWEQLGGQMKSNRPRNRSVRRTQVAL